MSMFLALCKARYLWLFILLSLMGTILAGCSPARQTTLKLEAKPIKTDSMTVVDAVTAAATRLGVPDKYVKVKNKDNGLLIQLPINRKAVELNFANVLITRDVLAKGGLLVDGTENPTKQYQEILYYDPSNKTWITTRLDYSREYESSDDSDRLVVIVDDFGNNEKYLSAYNDLPGEVVFSIIPGQPYSVSTMNKAVAAGHETIVHIPMEPKNYPHEDPGKNAIFVEMKDEQIGNALEKYFKELSLCQGGNNHMGSLATADSRTMQSVMNWLHANGHFFIDSRTTVSSLGRETAQQYGVPFLENCFFLDKMTTEEAWQHLKDMPRSRRRKAVIITHYDPEKLIQLKEFLGGLSQLGIKLSNATDMMYGSSPEIR